MNRYRTVLRAELISQYPLVKKETCLQLLSSAMVPLKSRDSTIGRSESAIFDFSALYLRSFNVYTLLLHQLRCSSPIPPHKLFCIRQWLPTPQHTAFIVVVGVLDRLLYHLNYKKPRLYDSGQLAVSEPPLTSSFCLTTVQKSTHSPADNRCARRRLALQPQTVPVQATASS